MRFGARYVASVPPTHARNANTGRGTCMGLAESPQLRYKSSLFMGSRFPGITTHRRVGYFVAAAEYVVNLQNTSQCTVPRLRG